MSEPQRCEPDLLVLHTLRCVGFTSADRLAETVAYVATIDVEDVLLTLAIRGLVTHTGGAFGGWGLTDAGRQLDAEWIAAELETAGARADVEGAYDDFLPLNQTTLEICHDWQMRTIDGSARLNDHADAAYDAAVLVRLAAVDAKVQPVCARLTSRLQRCGHYAPRLRAALDGARRGETGLVTDSVDSYHSVWFQLHEDLLATLGLSRDS